MSEEVIVTSEFVKKNAKHLYNAAIHATNAWRIYTDAPTIENIAQVGRHFRLLRKALTRFNYGVDPLEKGGAKEALAWFDAKIAALEAELKESDERDLKK